MFRRYGAFEGGILLPEQKQATLDEPIAPAPRAGSLRVPLAPCGGRSASLRVPPGEHVAAGQKLAEAADENGTDVFAPLSGRIGKVVEALVISPEGAAIGPAIELEAVGAMQPLSALPGQFDWRSAKPEDLLSRLAGGGLATSRAGSEPLERWAGRARRKLCRTLVANVVEGQPFVTADHRLLAEHGAEVVRGLAILASAIGAKNAILAVDRRRTGDYRPLEPSALACGVSTVAVEPIYPIGNDTILVKVLSGREVPIGGEALDVRVAVTDASTCFAAYCWVACGVPQTGRVVTVAGGAALRQGNFFAPIGMACSALAGAEGSWLVHGGPMTGQLCGELAVVSGATDAILAIAPVVPAVAAPCIRCGWCTDHCPARLNVSALNDLYELGQIHRAERVGALGCVGCGVCTYVCPARLPLSQRCKQLKRMIRRLQAQAPGTAQAAPTAGHAERGEAL
jgi:Na+-translocating ferredoxin:NAD+ oxidoreductase subunit C